MGNENQGRSIFQDKLIIRVRDWPSLVPERKNNDDDEDGDSTKFVPQYDLETSIEKCKESDMARFLNGFDGDGHTRISLPIEFAPGGPTKPGNILSKVYNDYLFKLIFSSINPQCIFTKDNFVDNFYQIVEEYSDKKSLISDYLQSFDFKDVDLSNHVDDICQRITVYFTNLRQNNNSELNTNDINANKRAFFSEFDGCLNQLHYTNERKICEKRELIENRFDLQYNSTREIFRLRREFIEKKNKAKNNTEKRFNVLDTLSDEICKEAASAAGTFFQDFEKSYFKFREKEEKCVRINLQNSKYNAMSALNNNRFILGQEISTLIENDINQIYNYLENWPNWLPHQKGNGFKRFIGRVFHNNKKNLVEKSIKDHPGMIGLFKKEWRDDECCRGVIIENRSYRALYKNLVMQITQKEVEKELIEGSSENFINQLKQIVPDNHNLLEANPTKIKLQIE